MYDTSFNVHAIEYGCRIYGPGRRTVIWFQGCSIRCPGCWNQAMWSTEPKFLIERDGLLEIIQKSECEGVTFLGGEPLEQPHNLLWLIKNLQEKNIGMMLYTGYEREEVDSNPLFKSICEIPDIVVFGRYNEEERDVNLTWRGSKNQIVMIRGDIEAPQDANHVELRIDEDGRVTIMGYPEEFFLESGYYKN